MDQIEAPWSPQEDEMLQNIVGEHGPINWSLISKSIPGRSDQSCMLRWSSIYWSFTPQEDRMLQNLVEKHGHNWSLISKSIPGKSDNLCRSRFLSINRPFTPVEDVMLHNLVQKHGPNWSLISKSIPGKLAKTCELRWDTVWNPLQIHEDVENHSNSTLKWKNSSMTNNEDITNGDHNIYIPPPSFSDIGRGQGSSYIHDGNLSHEVGGLSESAPSISYMARVAMSLGGMHAYSRNEPAPSWNALNKRDLSPMMIESDYFESAPSWNALNKRDFYGLK